VHRISDHSKRCYTINTRILAGVDAREGVTHVTSVISGFFEDAVTGKKSKDIKAVTPVTPVTPQKRIEGVSKDGTVEQPSDDLDIPTFLDRRHLADAEFRPGTLCTEDDMAFIESDGFK
jgi:hypothetical protein